MGVDPGKPTVVASLLGALAFAAYYGAPGWPRFPVICALAFTAGLVSARLAGNRAIAAPVVVLPLVPAVISTLHGNYYWNYLPLCTSWTLGALFRADLRRWHLPAAWRLPVSFWTLIIAVSWPIVVAREADFHVSVLEAYVANSGVGGFPWYWAAWVANTAVIAGVSLLWFDWLFEAYGSGNVDRFKREVVFPAGACVVVASLVAWYQGLVDITWMSGGQWPSHHRAPGTMMDGDAFGALVGWWAPAFAALGLSARETRGRLLAAFAFVATCGAVWTSGSRMALVGAVLGLAFAVPVAAHAGRVLLRAHGRIVIAGTIVCAVLAAVAFTRISWTPDNAIVRTAITLPEPTPRAVWNFIVYQFWNRGAPYGSASMQMIRESPITGIGLGAYHIVFPDYAFMLTGAYANPDNAQSWYRHQLAELGVVGSLGWIALLISFGCLLWRARPREGFEAEGRILRGAALAIGVVSMVSMPGQNIADAFAVVLLAFWCTALLDTGSLSQAAAESPGRRRIAYGAAYLVVALYAAISLDLALFRYRPPLRALRGGWPYIYGFYEPEQIDGRPARWMEGHGVAVVEAPERWARVTYWANHADMATRPVLARIWCDGARIADARLTSTEPNVAYCRVPENARRVIIEASVDHVVRPSDLGATDTRELGLALAWSFVDRGPD